MTPSTFQRRANGLIRRWIPAVFVLAVLGACASAPPSLGFLDSADEQALGAASEGALEHAPLELKWAREKLTEARSAADSKDYTLARQLAQQSSVNSELARAKTAAAKARDNARRARESNDALTIELGAGDLK